MHDLRYAIRGLARSPGFAITVILTLAFGIGSVTSIFSVADAILLRPLPYPQSGRLVMVWDELAKLGVERLGLYGQIFHEYAQTAVFDATAAFELHDRNLTGDRDSERVASVAATPSLFPMLGAAPMLGRSFNSDDRDAALLSHNLFVRRYAADSAIVGQRIRLDGHAYTVIGVMPPDFEFSEPSDIWTPLVVGNQVGLGTLGMLGRLAPGVSLQSARSAMDAEAHHLAETMKPHFGPNGEDPGFRVKLIPLRDELLGSFRNSVLVLLCAVSAVLLIVCVNIASLIWVRFVIREKETAIRRALGASRSRLIRQWLSEAAVLATIGGTLGAVVAQLGIRVLIKLTAEPSCLPSRSRALVASCSPSLRRSDPRCRTPNFVAHAPNRELPSSSSLPKPHSRCFCSSEPDCF
jgi:putative ABC transport system permease protein